MPFMWDRSLLQKPPLQVMATRLGPAREAGTAGWQVRRLSFNHLEVDVPQHGKYRATVRLATLAHGTPTLCRWISHLDVGGRHPYGRRTCTAPIAGEGHLKRSRPT